MGGKESRYYWLKLKRDFFKRHDIQIIEGMPNGKDYILFYLKLLCESVDHEGGLRFSEQIPYNEEMLATITNTNVDIVRNAIKLFTQLHMMDIMDDGTYFMNEVVKMLGSETYWAQKKREQRRAEFEIIGHCPTNVQLLSNTSPTCPSKSIEKEKDIDKDIEKEGYTAVTPPAAPRVDYISIQNLYNSICKSLPKCTSLSESRKKAIKARLASGYTEKDFETLFCKAEASTFLKGKNKRDWKANFDWLIKDANMAKVLDGNYDETGKAVSIADRRDAEILRLFMEGV